MGKHKVYVYTICKNEITFVRRWMESMSEADGVFVLDTGSTDGTPRALEDLGAVVQVHPVVPWRFDTARNLALDMVPEDGEICVSVDLDEVLQPGWREKLERSWSPGTAQLRYRYTWSFTPDGREGVVFWTDKIHARHGFHWENPVHEILVWDGPGQRVIRDAEGVQMDHHPDPAKSRAQYLPLLEQAVREHPENDRNMHYLGREYMFRGMWKECEQTLRRHLAMDSAQWADERCASMRYLARAVNRQGRPKEAMGWLLQAIAQAPHLREPWLEAAAQALAEGEYAGCLYFASQALKIQDRGRTYITEPDSWGARPYDLAAVAAYYLGLYSQALEYGTKAAETEPQDARLQDNLRFYRRKAGYPG